MNIYEKIFDRLTELHMSQIELSRRTGIATSTISDWRKKKINPNWDSQLTKSLFQTRSSCYSVPEKFFTDDAYSDGVIRVNFLNCKEKYW